MYLKHCVRNHLGVEVNRAWRESPAFLWLTGKSLQKRQRYTYGSSSSLPLLKLRVKTLWSWLWTVLPGTWTWKFLLIWATDIHGVFLCVTSFDRISLTFKIFHIFIVFHFAAVHTEWHSVSFIKPWSVFHLKKHLHPSTPFWVYSLSRVISVQGYCDFPMGTPQRAVDA